MKIHLADSEYWADLGDAFQQRYTILVKESYEKAAALLPFGSSRLNFFVQPREYDLIEETHDSARTCNSEFIELAFDPTYYASHPDTVGEHIVTSVFHEMNHAARFNIPIWHNSFLDSCVLEGLATAFERDYAGAKPLWADYPAEADVWLTEIQQNLETLDPKAYMFEHSDGRKWIGYKVGTYVVDRAMKKSGKSVIELTKLECAEILELAGVKA